MTNTFVNIVRGNTEDEVIIRQRDSVTQSYNELRMTEKQLDEFVFELKEWFQLKKNLGIPSRIAPHWLKLQ